MRTEAEAVRLVFLRKLKSCIDALVRLKAAKCIHTRTFRKRSGSPSKKVSNYALDDTLRCSLVLLGAAQCCRRRRRREEVLGDRLERRGLGGLNDGAERAVFRDFPLFFISSIARGADKRSATIAKLCNSQV